MSKIKHIHLYRNGTVLDNRDSAVVKLNEFINGSKYDDLDGVAILARYKSTSNGVQTLVGFESSLYAHLISFCLFCFERFFEKGIICRPN